MGQLPHPKKDDWSSVAAPEPESAEVWSALGSQDAPQKGAQKGGVLFLPL